MLEYRIVIAKKGEELITVAEHKKEVNELLQRIDDLKTTIEYYKHELKEFCEHNTQLLKQVDALEENNKNLTEIINCMEEL